MVRRVKSFKAGYVVSDSNLAPTATLHDVLELKARTGHSTIAITADGTPNEMCIRDRYKETLYAKLM